MQHIIRKVSKQLMRIPNAVRYAGRRKVFCIGRNKTGTTSMAALFREVGLPVAPQRPAELMVKDWYEDDFRSIINFVKYRGVAFQDVPFSLPKTYRVLDQEFPDSKFILTVRDSPDEWYQSLLSFHAKKFGEGDVPGKEDLQNADYIYPGWIWEANRMIYGTPPHDIYNEESMKEHYRQYNERVKEYFKDRPDKLLVVNVKEPGAAKKICDFLGVEKQVEEMPWRNKT